METNYVLVSIQQEGKDRGSKLPSTGAIASENRQPAVIKKQVMKAETLNWM